jgi:hypothetical protein
VELSEVLKPDNSWHRVYWFARMLINSDKYVAIGKEPKLLTLIVSSLKLAADKSNGHNTLSLQKQVLRNTVEGRYRRTESTAIRVQRLLTDLDAEITDEETMNVFIATCEGIMIPLQQAISNIPSDDKAFTLNIAKSFLDIKGDKGLASVILLWDDLGVRGCLTAERAEIIRAFTALRILLARSNLSDEDKDIVLSAFTQEFERRAGQKRKKRAGGSLEEAAKFILDYYHIKCAEAPEHFQADIEVDNWIKTKDGWLIGISCKRTLRERWKQVSSADSAVLGKFKIKYLYHIVTYDEDLPDDSRRLKYAQEHVGLKDYVQPISLLIQNITGQIENRRL